MSPAAQRKPTALEMEVAAGDDPVAVLLAGASIAVLPVRQWRTSGLRALREGDFDTWAEKCLADGGYDTWQGIDPTVEDVENFFTAWAESSGQSAGKSPASPRSSKTIRTR